MKDLTYIKVKEGKLWASDMVKPDILEPKYYNNHSLWKKAMEAFNQSFVEATENVNLALTQIYSNEYHAGRTSDHILDWKPKDGLYPVSGLQFEVREQYYHEYDDEWYDSGGLQFSKMRKVAILSLKQEQPSEEKEDLTWEKLKSAGSKMLFTPIGTPASPVVGEKEERIELLEIELSNTKILLEACESALAQRDARIKALEEEVIHLQNGVDAGQEMVNEKNEEIKALEERLEKVTKIINHELAEIPKLQDFASKHGDAQGYARICGQEIILETLKQKFDKLKH